MLPKVLESEKGVVELNKNTDPPDGKLAAVRVYIVVLPPFVCNSYLCVFSNHPPTFGAPVTNIATDLAEIGELKNTLHLSRPSALHNAAWSQYEILTGISSAKFLLVICILDTIFSSLFPD